MPDAPRNLDRTYNAQRLTEWWAKRGASTSGQHSLLLDDDEPDPLERQRLAKAIAAERQNQIAEGRLVDIEQFEAWWNKEVSGRLLRMTEDLRVRCGRDAAAIAENALEQIAAAMEDRSVEGRAVHDDG
jgi:hypothetical protein